MPYRAGELAKRAGLTVRALHHYEKLGLLLPSARTEAGYRQYTDQDVYRLHRIVAYQQLGLALKDIRDLLDAEDPPLQAVLAQQIERIEAQIARQQRLLQGLRRLVERARSGEAGLADHLLVYMAMARMHEKYFTEEERRVLDRNCEAMGKEGMVRSETEWPELISAVRKAMAQGIDPRCAEVYAMAQRWVVLTEQFVGKDEAIRNKVRDMYATETSLQEQTGVTPAVLDYLRKSIAWSASAASSKQT